MEPFLFAVAAPLAAPLVCRALTLLRSGREEQSAAAARRGRRRVA